eukprot:TRINITY_DN50844_c0_g1_i1.p1 TRINITY_DN50844_c0_g1~~TRINITY_DN50844_c0_g1_i1.p1  ORF type:complete len:280 (-),score=35.51 TRINITY_DN50844_c0_g1_i1:188-1027(-)
MAAERNKARIIGVICLYAFAGTSLTLANKLVATQYPFANTVMFLQCAVTVPLVWTTSWMMPWMGEVNSLEWSKVRRWLLLVCLFVGILLSSFAALRHVSMASLVVVRNLTAVITCIAEYFILGSQTTGAELVCLILIVAGTALYGSFDGSFDLQGYLWLSFNSTCSASFQIYLKTLSHVGLTPMGSSYYNNLLSLPVFAGMSLAFEPQAVTKLFDLDFVTSITLAVSTLLGMLLSVSAFLLTRTITATSQMVVNNMNKFLLVSISAALHDGSLGPNLAV